MFLNDEELRELIPNSLGMRKLISMKIKQHHQQEVQSTSSLPSTVTLCNTDDLNASTSTCTSTNMNLSNNDVVLEEVSLVDIDITDLLSVPTTFPDFELHTLLQTSPMGNSVLKYYQTNKILDNTRRSRLVDLIIKHLYNYVIKNRLRHDEFNKIAAKIIILFPKESMGTYYVPPIKKSESLTGKSVMARGKLVDKVRNLIHKCDEASPKRTRTSSDKRKNERNEDATTSKKVRLEKINENEDVIWLKVHSEPWNEVMLRWEKTYELRVSAKDTSTVADFLNLWPSLRDLRSEVLINSDFNKLYPGKELKLHTKWKAFISKIINLKAASLKDAAAIQLLEARDETENEDAKFLIELMSLPYLIPPKGRVVHKTKSQKHWKFSTLETTESIVVQAKTPGDIEDVVQKQKDKAASRHQSVQPYLLVEGRTLQEPRTFYVVVDDLHLQFVSAKQAFDTLFKLFHTLSARYPVQAEYLYILIQKGIYEINLAVDQVPPYIIDVLTHITTSPNDIPSAL